MNDLKEQHDRKIRELARKYRAKGFAVLEEPTRSDLPSFLRDFNFQPDLIAKSPEESFVIEVATRNTKERLARFAEFADTVNKKKGWQFMVVMTNPRVRPSTPIVQRPLDASELRDSLDDFSELVALSGNRANRFDDAALLAGWALVEATLRLGMPAKKAVSPRSMVRDGVMLGLLSKKDAAFLETVAETRNKLAHGFSTERESANMLGRLETTLERLVAEAETEHNKALDTKT